jgi:GATA-binding protein
MKKKQSLPATTAMEHMNIQPHDNVTAAALAAVRKASQQKAANGHGHPTDSPISRTGTPNMYDPHLTALHQDMNQFNSDGLPQYPLPGGSPHNDSPTNGEQQHLDIPQTHEQLIAANSSLKTRVSELDLINELYRGRLTQLEQDSQNADNLRHNADMAAKDAATERMQREEIQRQLEESHRRENLFKRRLDEMELENQELKTKLEQMESDRHAKKPKLSHNEEEQELEDAPQKMMDDVSEEVTESIPETVQETAPEVTPELDPQLDPELASGLAAETVHDKLMEEPVPQPAS